MTTEKKHTPLPWNLNKCCPNGTGYQSILAPCGGQVVGMLNPRHEIPNNQQDDAAFIVRACNSHYELLQALEAIVFQASQGKVFERDACITQAKEAIAKAKRNT